MARYSLKPYQSTYVDPKSAEINNQLRQNFEASFNSDDALAGAVDEMDAAGFAGDQALLKELEGSTRDSLEQRASRGDYETMGMDVAKSARAFSKGYAPIKQNHAAQQAYRASIKEAYEKGVGKPGGIDAETYQKAMAMSTHGYTGLQKNEDGTIDEGSFFSGRTLVGDVDISARMSEYMKDYAEEKGGQTRTLQGQKRMGPDGMTIDDPEGTTYQIKVGEKWETIPEADVAEAFRNVTSQPDVQAALQQKAELRTFNMTDEDLRQNLLLDLDGDINDEEDGGLRGALAEAVEKGETEEAAALQSMIDQKEGLLGEAGIESTEEEMELRRQNARQEVMRGEMSREGNAAVSKYGYTNVYSEYEEKYDKKWMQDRKASLDAKGTFVADLLTKSSMTQINNVGGNTISEISASTAEYQASADATVKEINDLLGLTNSQGGGYTAEQILAGEMDPEVVHKLNDVAPNILKNKIDKLIQSKGDISIQNALMDKARDAVGQKASFDAFLTESFGDKTGQEVLDNARKISGDPNMTLEQLLAVQKLSQSKSFKDSQSSERTSETFTNTKASEEELNAALFMGKLNTFAYGESNLPFGITSAGLKNSLRDIEKENTSKMDAWLEDNARITVGGMVSTVIPGIDKASTQANTKKINAHFLKKPLDKHFEIFYDGQKQDGTGTVAGLIEDNEWDGEDVEVVDVGFHTSPILGEPSMQMKVKGTKDGATVYKTIIVPYSNIKQSGLSNYFTDPSYKMSTEVSRARNAGLTETEISWSGGSKFKWDGIDGDNPTITYTAPDGREKIIDAASTVTVKGVEVSLLDTIIQDAVAAGQTFHTTYK